MEDGKGNGTGVEKEGKCQNLQQTLGDSSAALLAIASPLSIAHIDEDICGDLLWYEPIRWNPCSDSIDDLLLVWDTMQLVLGVLKCSGIGCPSCEQFALKKNNGLDVRGRTVVLEKVHIDRSTN